MQRKPALVVAVSGNIGAGKSTFVRAAASGQYRDIFLNLLDNYPEIPKTVNAYEEQFDRNLLGFASEDSWYYLPFQLGMLVNSSTLDGLIAKEGGIAFLDRTVYEHRYIFGQMQYALGKISERNFKIYQQLFTEISANVPPPSVYIRLMASEDSLRKRIAVRGRPQEKWLLEDKSYLGSLEKAFTNLFETNVNQPVIKVQTDNIVLAGSGQLDHHFFEQVFPYIAKEIERLDILKGVK